MAAQTSSRSQNGFLLGSAAALLLLPVNLFAQSPAPTNPSPDQLRHSRSTQQGPADSRHASTLPPPTRGTQAAAPIVRAAATPTSAQVSANPNPSAPGAPRTFSALKGEHLDQWMQAHSTLTLPQQQEALDKEPGFRDLPAPTQQRIHDRLAQLSAMPPDQRQRMIRRNEMMEKLPPEQRAEVRSALLQLSGLPPDQRKIVSRAFRDLRGLPPEQRIPLLNSRYRFLTDQQRITLTNLMHVEPLLPPDEQQPR